MDLPIGLQKQDPVSDACHEVGMMLQVWQIVQLSVHFQCRTPLPTGLQQESQMHSRINLADVETSEHPSQRMKKTMLEYCITFPPHEYHE